MPSSLIGTANRLATMIFDHAITILSVVTTTLIVATLTVAILIIATLIVLAFTEARIDAKFLVVQFVGRSTSERRRWQLAKRFTGVQIPTAMIAGGLAGGATSIVNRSGWPRTNRPGSHGA